MRQIIRQNVFETNSSSVHSFTLGKYIEELDLDLHFNEYGWGIYNHNTPLDYLFQVMLYKDAQKVLCGNQELNSVGEVLNLTKAYNQILEVLKDQINFNKSNFLEIIEKNVQINTYGNKKLLDWTGYIDHQSIDDYEDMQDFLNCNAGGEIEVFIRKGTIILCDNDNHNR